MIPGIMASVSLGEPDGPTNWNPVPDTAFPGGASTNWQYLSANPNTGVVVISGVGGKFFRSTDYGETWTPLTTPGGETSFLRIGGWVNGTNWIAQGNTNSTYMTSSDDGLTWTPRTFAYTPSGLSPMYIDHFNEGRVYTVNSGNIYVSSNSGLTFSATPLKSFVTTSYLVISPIDGTVLALLNGVSSPTVTPSRWSVSTDMGVTWSPLQTLMASGITYYTGVHTGTHWVIGSPAVSPSTYPLKYSTDLVSWTDIPDTAVSAWDMGFNAIDESTVVVGDAYVTPMTSRNSITTWVSSPVEPPPGVANPLFLHLAPAGDYWLAAGSAGLIRAPRAR